MSQNETPNPAGILCGRGHRHGSLASVKSCYFGQANPQPVSWADAASRLASSSAPTPAPMPAARPSAAPVPASEAQLEAIRRHGVTPRAGMTGREARETLGRLIEARDKREAELKLAGGPATDGEKKLHTTNIGLPVEILFDIRRGRFAVSTTGTKRLDFVRLSVVKPSKTGKHVNYEGCLKVQTQHGEQLRTRAYITPAGEVFLMTTTMNETYLAQVFMSIIVDQKAAQILYGREKGQCCRCGKELTDERSRYYGIGPECEKQWPEIVDETDEAEGMFVPGQRLEQ